MWLLSSSLKEKTPFKLTNASPRPVSKRQIAKLVMLLVLRQKPFRDELVRFREVLLVVLQAVDWDDDIDVFVYGDVCAGEAVRPLAASLEHAQGWPHADALSVGHVTDLKCG